MLVLLTFFFSALGYFYFKSRLEATFVEGDQLDMPKEKSEDDDLYKDLEDLFI